MVSQKTLLLAVAGAFVCSFGFTGLTGCNSKSYPQYSGVYTLAEPPVFDVKLSPNSRLSLTDVLDHYRFPNKMEITHRLHFQNASFFQALRFEPKLGLSNLSLTPEADKPFAVELAALTRVVLPSIDYPELNGANVLSMRGQNLGINPDCGADYKWNIFIEPANGFSASPSLLSNIYLTHEQIETNRGPVPVLLTADRLLDPPQDAQAVLAWDESLLKHGGLTIRLTLTMAAVGAVGGCKIEDGDFPQIDQPFGTITATYHADTTALDQSTNPVTQDISALKTNADSGAAFWSQIINLAR